METGEVEGEVCLCSKKRKDRQEGQGEPLALAIPLATPASNSSRHL